jgi:IclR family transcriptional regulator, KDG regulon repressor
MLGTLIRAGDVLDLFTFEEPEWGVTATAQRLGIGKSLAHEALATLTAIGLLQRVGHGRYRLGWRNVSLATVLLRTNALSAHARPIVRDLAQTHDGVVSLVAWDRGRIIFLGRHERGSGRAGPIHRAPIAGTTAPVDDSAGARVLLASRPADELRALWGAGSVRTRHPTLAELDADLAEVRRCGWACDGEEAGAPACAAAPVRDAEGEVATAISLASGRLDGADDVYRNARLVVAAASRISQAIRGGVAPI